MTGPRLTPAQPRRTIAAAALTVAGFLMFRDERVT